MAETLIAGTLGAGSRRVPSPVAGTAREGWENAPVRAAEGRGSDMTRILRALLLAPGTAAAAMRAASSSEPPVNMGLVPGQVGACRPGLLKLSPLNHIGRTVSACGARAGTGATPLCAGLPRGVTTRTPRR